MFGNLVSQQVRHKYTYLKTSRKDSKHIPKQFETDLTHISNAIRNTSGTNPTTHILHVLDLVQIVSDIYLLSFRLVGTGIWQYSIVVLICHSITSSFYDAVIVAL